MQPWLKLDLLGALVFGIGIPLWATLRLVGGAASRWLGLADAALLLAGSCTAALGIAQGHPSDLWLPPAALAGAGALSLALRWRWLRQALAGVLGLVRQPRLQGVVLLVAGPLLALAWYYQYCSYQYRHTRSIRHPDSARGFAQRPSGFKEDWAVTDAGRPLQVFAPEDPHLSASVLRADEARQIDAHSLNGHFIRMSDPWPDCNCHGWVFTGGRYWVLCGAVDQILAENGYRSVVVPREGDLAIYRDPGEVIIHTGVVRASWDGGHILIESKWGKQGLFVHPPDAVPYVARVTYYRSARHGHLVDGLPGTSSYRRATPPPNEPLPHA